MYIVDKMTDVIYRSGWQDPMAKIEYVAGSASCLPQDEIGSLLNLRWRTLKRDGI